jgi:hypothetical protein
VGGSSDGTGGSSGASGASAGGSAGGPIAMPQNGITVRFKAAETNTTAPVSGIEGEMHIVNTDGASIPLNELKVRYYFTNEMTVTPSFESRWGQLQSNNSMSFTFTGVISALPTPQANADSYIEFSYNDALSLDPGKRAVAAFRVWDATGQQKFLQDNDYSFTPTEIDSDKIVLLHNGVIIWGVAP